MTDNLAGKLLVASTALFDPNFVRTVIFIIQHDEEGALGVVLNRPSESPVESHLPWLAPRTTGPGVVFVGGPVEPEIAIALEQTSTTSQPTPLDGVGILDVSDDEGESACRVFSGYSGWGGGQLEAELAQDAWIVLDALVEDVFTPDPESLWSAVLKRQGGRLAMLSTYPPDPALN